MKNKKIVTNIFLLFLSVLLFVFANPDFIFSEGIGFLAFFYFIPVFILIDRVSLKTAAVYGGFYGALCYGLYAYWLYTFNSFCLLAVCIVYFLFLAVVFVLLKLCNILFKKNGWLLQWLCICSFEYLKSLGFLGFNYGNTAYTQWKNTCFIQFAKITGPWGVSAFILFFSALMASYFIKIKHNRLYNHQQHLESLEKLNGSNVSNQLIKEKILDSFSLKSNNFLLAAWCVLFCVILIYGNYSIKKVQNYKTIKIAAIQSNESPWKNGVEAQTQDIQRLMELTDEALELNPDIKLVVWPETAVVSAIVFQYETQKDERKFELVKRLLEYINSKSAVFVIGNGHEVNSLKSIHDVYNSALVFIPGKNVLPPEPKVYSKIKLVPFSEYFPYSKQFSGFAHFLRQHFLHQWTPGKEIKVFNVNNLFFSTPICFEDTFPEISRKMFKKGARCFINLSNDSWSESESCQNQHLAMAVFRSVENGVPTVRSTTSGQTCIISKNGVVQAQCSPFSSSYVTGDVQVLPQYEKPTFYNKTGDVFGVIPVFLFFILLIIKALFVIIKKSNK